MECRCWENRWGFGLSAMETAHAACLQSGLTGPLSQGSLTLGKTEANSALTIASPMIVPSKGPRCCFRPTAEALTHQ